MGNSERDNRDYFNDNPGVGSYNLAGKYGGGIKWKIGRKHYAAEDFTDYPGPGNYNVTGRIGDKGYSIAGRYDTDRNPDNPGPGAYSPDGLNKGKATKFGTGPQIVYENYDNEVPGPGAYDPNIRFSHVPGTGMGIGERRPATSGEKHPGPGYYDINRDMGGPKVYSLSLTSVWNRWEISSSWRLKHYSRSSRLLPQSPFHSQRSFQKHFWSLRWE